MTSVSKLFSSLTSRGPVETISWLARAPVRRFKRWKTERQIFRSDKIAKRFTIIYEANYWSSAESVSGVGSTLEATKTLRRELPNIFQKYSIRSVLDAPCGDFNWMGRVLDETAIRYIGGDIVAPLISKNSERFGSERVSFELMDITSSSLPPVDLMICRDCLFHLSYDDTRNAFKRFVESGIPLLLTTTHTGMHVVNSDIQSGSFREIDLFGSPYNLSSQPLERVRDGASTEPSREMCLWTRRQVEEALRLWQL